VCNKIKLPDFLIEAPKDLAMMPIRNGTCKEVYKLISLSEKAIAQSSPWGEKQKIKGGKKFSHPSIMI